MKDKVTGKDFKEWLKKYGLYNEISGVHPSALEIFGASRATFYRRVTDDAVIDSAYVNQCDLIDMLSESDRELYFASRRMQTNPKPSSK